MVWAHADNGRARFPALAYGCPAHAGCEQSGKSEDGQKPASHVHGLQLRPRKSILSDNEGDGGRLPEEGALAARGVRRGEGVVELAAKGSALPLGGSISCAGGFCHCYPYRPGTDKLEKICSGRSVHLAAPGSLPAWRLALPNLFPQVATPALRWGLSHRPSRQ